MVDGVVCVMPFLRKKVVDVEAGVAEEQVLHDDIHRRIDERIGVAAPVVKPSGFSAGVDIPDQVVDISKNKSSVEYVEKVGRLNWNRALLYLTVLGIMGIIFFTMYMKASPAFLLLTWMFGMMCFLPLGLILGWLFLNPDVRCLMLRRMRGRNYGMVNFVHRGGQRMVTRIKNFDDDVIIQDTKMWILQNDGIYYVDRDRNKMVHAKIDSKHIKTMSGGIPVLYLDPDTMIPLTFHSVQSMSNPQQFGSTILGYIYNQLAKALFMKKGLQIFFIIILVLTGMCLAATIQIAIWVNEVHEALPTIMDRMARLGELISDLERLNGVNETVIPLPDVGGGGS